jgi:hypothetical protein
LESTVPKSIEPATDSPAVPKPPKSIEPEPPEPTEPVRSHTNLFRLLEALAPSQMPQVISLVTWLNSTSPGWYDPSTLELTGINGSDVLHLIKYIVLKQPLRRPPIGIETFLQLLRNAPPHVLDMWSDYASW